MSWHGWILFVLVETMLCLAPGPAVLLVLSQGLTFGWRGSIAANLGILAGNAAYFALSATGLGAVLLASYDLFFAITWIRPPSLLLPPPAPSFPPPPGPS